MSCLRYQYVTATELAIKYHTNQRLPKGNFGEIFGYIWQHGKINKEPCGFETRLSGQLPLNFILEFEVLSERDKK